MKISTNINILFFIVFISITNHHVQSYFLESRDPNNENGMEPYLMDDEPLPIDENEYAENVIPTDTDSYITRRRSESAEKYFDWASKTNRPMEYFRGKRFWLFTKKDEHGNYPDPVPGAHSSPNTLSQGIWRSGIVGRRRR